MRMRQKELPFVETNDWIQIKRKFGTFHKYCGVGQQVGSKNQGAAGGSILVPGSVITKH
jgi:hypothetical protein